MLPRTLGGWALLIFAVMILMYGMAGAITHVSDIAHQVLTGLRSFGQARG